MDDQDLSGDDLKYVSYAILFTKPDYEATLEKRTEELLNYSTDGASYAGLKIAKFFKKVAKQEIPRPSIWGTKYPPGAKGDKDWEIPEEDEKYVTFVYKVERRVPKQDADREKDKVTVLREIRDRLGSDHDGLLKEISRKLG